MSVAALFVLFGSQGLQSVSADGDTRAVSLHHIHTGEDISITFKRAGRYDEEALKKLDWFLRDWRREQSTHMDPHLLDLIWEVTREVGAKEPIQVVCGYRSPETNAMLRHRSRGVAQYSQHTVGRAMDFYIPGVPLEQLRIAGLRLQRGGVGFYPTSGSPFVHLDTGSVRHWPRMTHDQLVRVFPDGKTVHVPADGKPLAHYAQALTEVRRRGSTPSATILAQARDAGAISESDAQAAGTEKPKRGFLAKLFGFNTEDEDADAADQSVHAPAPVAAPKPTEVKPVRVAAVAPPKTPTRPGKFTPAVSPTDIVPARGTWSNAPAAAAVTEIAERADARAAMPLGAVNESGQQLVWMVGPEGQPAPRPPQEIVVASAEPEATAAIGWQPESAKDRVPADIALAYAAAPAAAPEPTPRPAPMGILGAPAPVAAAPAAAPAPVAAAAPRAFGGGEKISDPWLRGIVVVPSVQYALHVSVLGPTDYRTLRPLFAKPSFVLAMMFSEDPHFGMSAEAFAGAAVSFLPTITFSSRTAGLR